MTGSAKKSTHFFIRGISLLYFPKNIGKWFSELIKPEGLQKITLHQLRHPYVKYTPKNNSKNINSKLSIFKQLGINIFCHSIVRENHSMKNDVLRSNNQCLSRILLQLNNSRHVTEKAVITGIPIINIIYNKWCLHFVEFILCNLYRNFCNSFQLILP